MADETKVPAIVAFIAAPFNLLGLILALVMYFLFKDKPGAFHPSLKEAANFAIDLFLLNLILGILLFIPTVGAIALLLYAIVFVLAIIVIVLAVLALSKDQNYEVPFLVRLLK